MTTRTSDDDRPAAETNTVQPPDISAIIANLQGWSFDGLSEEAGPKLSAQMPMEFSAAEESINIAELRIMLYRHMAYPRTDQVQNFYGFFLMFKTVYVEAETEIVKLRTEYIQEGQ